MKRGQAALEFLMTYGWAFLVVLILIGALAYFGVLSPKNFIGDKCFVSGGGFGCPDYKLSENKIEVGLTNLRGVDLMTSIETTNIVANIDGKECSGTFTVSLPQTPTLWQVETKQEYTLDYTPPAAPDVDTCVWPVGKKAIVKVSVPFTAEDGTIVQAVPVEITAKVN